MKPPDLGHGAGVANTLPYFLKMLRFIPLKQFHITGVTFYQYGQEYLPGYGIRTESFARHNADANKNYSLQHLAGFSDGWNGAPTSIDFPRCLRYLGGGHGHQRNLSSSLRERTANSKFFCALLSMYEIVQQQRVLALLDPKGEKCVSGP